MWWLQAKPNKLDNKKEIIIKQSMIRFKWTQLKTSNGLLITKEHKIKFKGT